MDRDMIKALFFDIDGTLVSFRTHRISDSMMAALHTLREKGVKLYIASGRHILVMDNLQDFPFDGYVCMNGGVVIDRGQIVSKVLMGSHIAGLIARRCMENSLPCVVYGEDWYGISMKNEETDRIFDMIRLKDVPLVSLADMDAGTVCQYTVFADERTEKEVVLDGLPPVETSRWYPDFFDINPAGLSKARGIESIISREGISRDEVMAFGDGGNDIEMIRYAGIGVAMGNATDPVKAAADYVTLSVDEDGVLHALKHFGVL